MPCDEQEEGRPLSFETARARPGYALAYRRRPFRRVGRRANRSARKP